MDNPATNATTPSNPPYKWVGESKQRSTFGILSICFSTLIICIWSTLHFDIPAKRYTTTRRFFIQISWMIFALLAPEVLLYLAIHEWIEVDELLKKVHKFHPHLAKPGLFTRMYNWIHGRAELKDKRYNPIKQMPQPHFGRVHAYYAVMGGFAFYDSYDDDTPKSLFEISTNPRCTVDVPSVSLLLYIMEHFPHIITGITEDHILDQAASSSLSKALLIVQVAWFCTNCASRLFQRLPLSLLEVTTAAHSFCTLLTYFVWWSKPLNVAAPTLLREKEAREVYALLKCSPGEYGEALEMAQKRAAGDSSMPTGPHGSEKIVLAAGALQHLLPILPRSLPFSVTFRDRVLSPSQVYVGSFMKHFSISITTAICPMIYGIPHFLAWSDQFPKPMERLVWRVCSIVVTCSGLVGVLLGVSSDLSNKYSYYNAAISRAVYVGVLTFGGAVPIAHVLASGFLVIESVRQLFFLNDAAYQLPSWSNYWPHLS